MGGAEGRERALVVGAASGIGAAAAARLVRDGWSVVGADRDLAGLERLDVALAGRVRMDVTDAASVAAGVSETTRTLGAIDALVNCAGTAGGGWRPFLETSPDQLDELHAVNLRGAFLLMQAVLPGMIEAGYGRILHVASIAGKEGVPGMSTYSSTKAGLIGLVKSVGREIATSGVTVNALAPAVIRTPLTDLMPEDQFEYLKSLIPMRRAADLEEVAAAIRWMVSEEASFTTGFAYDLSGGRADY